MARKKTKRKAGKPTKLETLIEEYVEARIADHEKGGGDPESYDEIEANLLDARHELGTYLHAVIRCATGEIDTSSLWVTKLLDDLRRFPTGT